MVVVTNWDVNKALVVLRTGRVLRAYKIALDLARSQNGMGELWCNLADQEHSALRREAV
jgi:hypothetical protein